MRATGSRQTRHGARIDCPQAGQSNCSKWSSVSQIEHRSGSNLSRLRQGYAFTRRSLRLAPEEEAESRNLLEQLSQRAARLWRGVYSKNKLVKAGNQQRHLEADPIGFTDGSFKMLTTNGSDNERLTMRQHPHQQHSDAELEIRQRLQRSKRRILPSAKYRAPESELACASLNLDELELIKRDNLRHTLLRMQREPKEITKQIAQIRSMDADCSCKEQLRLDLSEAHEEYCSCGPIIVCDERLDSSDNATHTVGSGEVGGQEGGEERRTSNESRASGGFVDEDAFYWPPVAHNENSDFAFELDGRKASQSLDDLSGRTVAVSSRNEPFVRQVSTREAAFKGRQNCAAQRMATEEAALHLAVAESASSTAFGAATTAPAPPSTATATATTTTTTTTTTANATTVIATHAKAMITSQELASCGLGGVTLAALTKQSQQQQQRLQQQQQVECKRLGAANRAVSVPIHAHPGANPNVKAKAKLFGQLSIEEVDSEQVHQQRFECAASAYDRQVSQSKDGSSFENGNRRAHWLEVFERKTEEPDCDEPDEEEAREASEAKMYGMKGAAATSWWDQTGSVSSFVAVNSNEEFSYEPQEHEHQYASIYGSNTPSPIRPDSLYDYYNTSFADYSRSNASRYRNERDIFAKQLKAAAVAQQQHQQAQQEQFSRQKASGKKSLLSRLMKNLIGQTTKEGKVQKQWHKSIDRLDSSKCSARQQNDPVRAGWQKSATLSSRSTQNLLGSSLRRLSGSRKSVDLHAMMAELQVDQTRDKATRGFFTLGRRNCSSNKQKSRQSMSQVFVGGRCQLEAMIGAERSGFGGSTDSLPSADSGLSCGNLQNSNLSDDNYASSRLENIYTQYGVVQQQQQQQHARLNEQHAGIATMRASKAANYQIMGKARAIVDCNPCAYDKEALVFKSGDIIDILERNQSGTWFGRCGGQVGHFKFINVTEIDENRHEDGQESILDGAQPEARQVSAHGSSMVSQETRKPFGSYITKLEIKSNQTDVPSRCQQTGAKLTGFGNQRSLMVPTARSAHKQQVAGKGEGRPSETGESEPKLSADSGNQNEPVMSSLEQLLFAIGLADGQVNEGGQQQANDQTGSIETGQEYSYLEKLNRSGVNNLDSFSTIDDLHALERMGILDDEHQRRLLMAARIIRQASRAAKLDFAQNYQFSKSLGTNENQGPVERDEDTDSNDSTKMNRELTNTSLRAIDIKITEPELIVRHANRQENDQNNVYEPIYVNLVNSNLESDGIIVYGRPSTSEHSVGDLDIGHERSDQNEARGMQSQSNQCCQVEKLLKGTNIENREATTNLINRADHYRTGTLSNEHGTYLSDMNDEVEIDFEGEARELSQLVRNYSVNMARDHRRAQVSDMSSAQRSQAVYNETRDISTDRSHKIDRSRQSVAATIGDNPSGQSVKDKQNKLRFLLNDNKQDHQSLEYINQSRFRSTRMDRLSPLPPVPLAHQGFYRDENVSNMRSQMNSKSAYDLKLDLSQFFS